MKKLFTLILILMQFVAFSQTLPLKDTALSDEKYNLFMAIDVNSRYGYQMVNFGVERLIDINNKWTLINRGSISLVSNDWNNWKIQQGIERNINNELAIGIYPIQLIGWYSVGYTEGKLGQVRDFRTPISLVISYDMRKFHTELWNDFHSNYGEYFYTAGVRISYQIPLNPPTKKKSWE